MVLRDWFNLGYLITSYILDTLAMVMIVVGLNVITPVCIVILTS